MKNIKLFFVALLVNAILFTACDKDNDPTTPQELITTVELRIALVGPIDTSHFYYYKDLDGTGGNPPVSDTIHLTAMQDYSLSVRFLDESNTSNTVDLTAEVLSEAEAHLVCYEATGASPLPSTSDTDGNGNPLGLVGIFTPGVAGTGKLRLSLKHEPDKSATDPCSTGETDVDVTFNVTIQ